MNWITFTSSARAFQCGFVLLVVMLPVRAVADVQAERSFARNVLPLLKSKCFACHGDDPDDVRGELDMLTRDGLLRGGESGEAALVVGQPDRSPMVLAAQRDHDLWSSMPPKDNDRLSEQQIEWIRQWIAADAVWPNDQRIEQLVRRSADESDSDDGIVIRAIGGLSGDWANRRYDAENLWAYRPLRRAPLETAPAEGQSSIDVFVQRKASALAVDLAPPADRVTLIRRATFDLLGLPPTPQEITAFVADPADDDAAFSGLVDRLLNSPHYGEQWARHWLDVVRYADSSGFANDYPRGNAWRYRDYVVRAFNDDKPYEQFVREQIAGDEMLELDERKRADLPSDRQSELLIATGFLRMGPWELTGMEVPKIARQRFLDDVTDIVGQVFLGHMLQCARCHDHKFDPVPTRDYYSIQAVFATTQLADRPAPFMAVENVSGFDVEEDYLVQRREYYERILTDLDRKAIAAARRWLADEGIDPVAFEQAVSSQETKNPSYAKVRSALLKAGQTEDQAPPRHVGFSPQDLGMTRSARKGLERLRWRRDRYRPVAMSVYSGHTPSLRSVYAPLRMPKNRMTGGTLEKTCILAGGSPFSPTDSVTVGVLSVIAALRADETRTANVPTPVAPANPPNAEEPVEGRRLALASWVASPENPLTSRVMVNRLWQWHFGHALAGNPNNFGATGKKPTHPELLDWLAAEFIRCGWSVKSMHRLMMNTDVYRRSSRHPRPDRLAERDVEGSSYAVFLPRRLDAEELRDAILAVSGELNLDVGGIPVRPEMNLEVALQPRTVMGTFAEAWQPSLSPSQRHRRTLYSLRLRGQRDPFQEVFNSPSPDLSCEARETSTVTPQVFALLNSPLAYDRAVAMAQRLVDLQLDERATIDHAMQLVYGRAARPAEVDACVRHWQRMNVRHQSLKFQRPQYPDEIVREAVDENTGEPYMFREPLEVYADFVPDLKPVDVEPNVRGLAEVCLVLLNSNEFAYVY